MMREHLSCVYPPLQVLESEKILFKSNLSEALLGKVEYLLYHKFGSRIKSGKSQMVGLSELRGNTFIIYKYMQIIYTVSDTQQAVNTLSILTLFYVQRN